MEYEHFLYQGDENGVNRNNSVAFANGVHPNDFNYMLSYDQGYSNEEYPNFRGNRGSFRPRGRGWMGGMPRFRGRGFNHNPRPRGFYHPRGGPRYHPAEWGASCRPPGPPPRFPTGVPLPNLAVPPPVIVPPTATVPPAAVAPPQAIGPPPHVPAPDLWVETRTEDGRVYYYLARTRETTWTRPQESPTCKVKPYEEVMAMVESGTLPADITLALPISDDEVTARTLTVTEHIAPPLAQPPWPRSLADGVVYGNGYHGIDVASPNGADAAPPQDYMMPRNYTSCDMSHGIQVIAAQPESPKPTVIPPDLEEEASKWTKHLAPDGRTYYYNAGEKKSVWVKPPPLAQMEELKRKIATEQGISETIVIDETKVEVIDVDAHAEAQAKAEAEREAERERRAEAQRLADIERQAAAELEAENRREAENQREAESLQRDMAQMEIEREKEKEEKKEKRPIYYCTHFYNTPWQVVWTEEGSVFFYNPKLMLSVWTRPADIQGREDIDQVVNRPPPALRARLDEQRALASKPPPPSTPSSDSDAGGSSSEGEGRATSPVREEPKTAETSDELAQQRAFRTLMEESKLTSKSSYLEFTIKFGRDPRFKGLLNARIRESQYADYIEELKRRDKRREKVTTVGPAMLRRSNG